MKDDHNGEPYVQTLDSDDLGLEGPLSTRNHYTQSMIQGPSSYQNFNKINSAKRSSSKHEKFNSVNLSAVKHRSNSDADDTPLRGFKMQKSLPTGDLMGTGLDLVEMKRKLNLQLSEA